MTINASQGVVHRIEEDKLPFSIVELNSQSLTVTLHLISRHIIGLKKIFGVASYTHVNVLAPPGVTENQAP